MFATHLKRVLLFAFLGALVGGAIFALSPRVYEANVPLLIAVDAGGVRTGTSEDVSAILSTGLSQNVATEAAILRGKPLFAEALSKYAEKTGNRTLLVPDRIDSLYRMYEVVAGRDSRVVNIVVKAYDPKLAADLANTIVETYNELRQTSAETSISQAQLYLQSQLDQARVDLRMAEAALRNFKAQSGIADLGSRSQQLVAYQSTLMQQLDQAKMEERTLQSQINAIKQNLPKLPDMVTESYSETQSPLVQRLEQQLAEYEASRTELLRTFTEDSRRVRELDELIKRTQDKLVEARKSQWRQASRGFVKDSVRKQFEDSLVTSQVQLAAVRQRIRQLTDTLGGVQSQIEQLPEKEMKLAQLTRDREVFDEKYQRLRRQMEDVRYKSIGGMRQATALFPASENPNPVAPDLARLLVVCTFGGAVVGFLYSLARESMRTTAQTSTELSHLMGLPVAATSPMLPPKTLERNLKSLASASFQPQESFKFMAFATLFSQGESPRRVLFTGIRGSVGCSPSAGQFAVAASRTGRRTILVDADLRHATLSKVFNCQGKPGVRELITHNMLPNENAEISIETEHPQLRIVPAGAADGPTISDVPVADVIGFLDALQEQADLIVIDAPPIDAVADTVRFVPFVDQVCLVVSAKTTRFGDIPIATDLLKRAGAKSVNVVLTGTDPEEEPFSRKSSYMVG